MRNDQILNRDICECLLNQWSWNTHHYNPHTCNVWWLRLKK